MLYCSIFKNGMGKMVMIWRVRSGYTNLNSGLLGVPGLVGCKTSSNVTFENSNSNFSRLYFNFNEWKVFTSIQTTTDFPHGLPLRRQNDL